MSFFIYALIVLVGLNFLALFICLIIRFYVILVSLKSKNPILYDKKIVDDDAFVSIHIPTHSEPPYVVLRTLKSLMSLSFKNYEVIVFDNNTEDRNLWLPLREFCNKHKRFKFVQAMGVESYKAGALNLAYQYIHPKTTHIMVIDADYCVEKNVLDKALSHFSENKKGEKKTGLVQFPQSYYNTTYQNLPLKIEYQHFFDVYMQAANKLDCVLCTGTMSIFSRECLESIGLWSGKSITEDVEMGIKVYQNKYRGVYVNEPLGKGIMPTDLEGLQTQRKRWVYGNMQTLISFFKTVKQFSLSQNIGIFAILTAWFSFLLIPIATFLLSTFIYMFYDFSPDISFLFLLLVKFSLISIIIELISKTFFLYISCNYRDSRCSLSQKVACFAVHFGMLWQTSTAWWFCLLGLPLGFERTNKFFKKDSHFSMLPNIIFLVLFSTIFILFLFSKLYILASITFLILLPLASIFYLFEIMNNTQRYTEKFFLTSVSHLD